MNKIAPCRTFVFLHELEPLFNLNLIKGGDLDNAIVVVENEIPESEIERLAVYSIRKILKLRGLSHNLQLALGERAGTP